MSFVMTYYFVALVVILITHDTITPVRGQCTVQGCDNGDPLNSIVAEMQLRVELFDKLNKQVQGIHELLNASLQETKSQHEIFNESFQKITSQHDVILTSLRAVDRRLEEHDICIRNQTRNSLEEDDTTTKSQTRNSIEEHDIFIRNQTRNSLEEHEICIRNQTRDPRELANGSCDPASDVCDCSDIKARGHTQSGVHEVCVGHQLNRICTSAFCDMETDNRASLVFQRRKDGSVNFNRSWTEYREGFGKPDGEFWLGNEMLYLLTSKRNYTLRVELEDFDGNKSFAEYSTFSIGSSAVNYRLTVSGYSGNAGDSMNYNNRRQFSTYDADNDAGGSEHCARRFGEGWWFAHCAYAHLNGLYHYTKGTGDSEMGFQWYFWRNTWQYPLKRSQMKLLPVV